MREILTGRSPASHLFYGCVAVAIAIFVPMFNPVGYLLGALWIVRGLVKLAWNQRSADSAPIHVGDPD